MNVSKTTAYLEDFFKVLLFVEEIELKNGFLRIGFEYGSKGAKAVAGLHRLRTAGLENLIFKAENLILETENLILVGCQSRR